MNFTRFLDRVVVFWFPFLLVLVLLTAWSFPAQAAGDLIARHPNGKDWVRLSQTKSCANKAALSNIPAEFRKQAKSGNALLEGVHYRLCWLRSPQDVVIFAYEDGDVGYIRFGYFKPVNES